MPDSLITGATSSIRPIRSNNYAGNGALTWAWIIKPTSTALDANYHWLVGHGSNGVGTGAFGIALNGQLRIYNGSSEVASSVVIPAASEWYLIAYSKPSGTYFPKVHLYRYSTNQWRHENAASTLSNWGAPSTPYVLIDVGGEKFDGSVLIGGVWDACLTDAQIETLITGRQAWIDLAPTEAFRFNGKRMSNSFIPGSRAWSSEGGGANFGTIDSGGAPSGWAGGISGVNFIGQNGVAFSAVSNTTLAMTFDRTIPVGEMAFICFIHGTGNGVVNSISDTGGNTWTRVSSSTPSSVHDFWWCPSVTTQINVGDTATATWSIADLAERQMLSISLGGLLTSSVLDQTAGATGTSTTPDTGNTGTTAQADEFMLGSIHISDATGTNLLTPDIETMVFNHGYDGPNHSYMLLGKILTSTGAYKLSGTLPTSLAWSTAAITLKGVERAGGVSETTKLQRSRNPKPILRRPVGRR